MGDVDDSSSESNIRVTGITDLAESPHTFNKKKLMIFYYLKMLKIDMLQG